MSLQESSRRQFLRNSAALCGGLSAVLNAEPQSIAKTNGEHRRSSYLDIVRQPDAVIAYTDINKPLALTLHSSTWSIGDLSARIEQQQNGAELQLPISLHSPGTPLAYLHLRWRISSPDNLRILGDHWERSYGDLEWRGHVPDRVMPWYFLTFDGHETHGYGVMTQPSTLCFWQLDLAGVSLWLDLRNGGNPVELGDRELKAATVVSVRGNGDEKPMETAHRLCKTMCPKPRLPQLPFFGSNDWYYAYGHNTASGILRNADLIASVTPKGNSRSCVVVDDGWQDEQRFPDMAGLASEIRTRNLTPGLWIRPMRAAKSANRSLLLSQARFSKDSGRADLAYDPTIPEALEIILDSIRTPVRWGYQYIKHDFSTYDIFGRWGSEMGAQATLPGWSFSNRTLTNAEIIASFYRSLRDAAGDNVTILGCNTVGHLAAGLFEAQRIGDDVSGTTWERTRRMGVNTLAYRFPQHRTFFCVDPDCIAITKAVPWSNTKLWLDLVARSGAALFVSPDPDATGPDRKAALSEAFSLGAASSSRANVEDWLDNTAPQTWNFVGKNSFTRQYNWCGNNGANPFQG